MSNFNDIKKLNATFLLIRTKDDQSFVEAYAEDRTLLAVFKKTAQNEFAPLQNNDHQPYFTQAKVGVLNLG